MQLEGSCHCKAVRFSVESHEPVPFMRCYCSICRKTAGTGGFAINLGAVHATLEVQGREHLSVYRARLEGGRQSTGQRHFCKHCGTALWLWDPTWPELVHPHAGAIDTMLPRPPCITHMMLGSKPGWVAAQVQAGDASFDEYPDESLADWHRRNNQSF
ncbi:MAG: GFA family protein [Burkholderiaceae bacterium]|nr:GFA family protein [Burkholderiaceae bacterium]